MREMTLKERRRDEIDAYSRIYSEVSKYHIGGQRWKNAQKDMAELFPVKRYLDVSCGRGELLDYAKSKDRVSILIQGTEVAAPCLEREDVVYAEAWDLPFGGRYFDLVSFMDVIEHILPEDTNLVLDELLRVTKTKLILTANNHPSQSLGRELHINKRDYDVWDAIFSEAAYKWGFISEWRREGRSSGVSQTWLFTSV